MSAPAGADPMDPLAGWKLRPARRKPRLADKLATAIDQLERDEARLVLAFGRWRKARAQVARISKQLTKAD